MHMTEEKPTHVTERKSVSEGKQAVEGKPGQGPAGLPSLPARPAPRGGLGALPARPTPAARPAPSGGASGIPSFSVKCPAHVPLQPKLQFIMWRSLGLAWLLGLLEDDMLKLMHK